MDAILAVWAFKFSLVPVVLTYALFDFPAVVRRFTRRAYTPIYFAFFPLGYTDELYAQYFGDSDFYGVGADLTPEERRSLRNRIIAISIFSIVIGVVVTPAVVGFLAANYLSFADFWQFVGFLVVVKGALLIKSWIGLRWQAPFYDKSKRAWVAALYVGYLVLVVFGLWWAYDLALQNLPKYGFWGTVLEVAKYATASTSSP